MEIFPLELSVNNRRVYFTLISVTTLNVQRIQLQALIVGFQKRDFMKNSVPNLIMITGLYTPLFPRKVIKRT